MVKGVDRLASMSDLRLLEKSGGKSGEWRRPEDPQKPAVARVPGMRGPRRGQR
jgi:hypothetical protein